MIRFYYFPSTNPAKVALFLEEAELQYQFVPIDIRKGEQFTPEFLSINPNAKTPALIDGDATLFDSTAILLYLAQKTGKFMGDPEPAARAQLLSWLMLIATGVAPYSGQAVYFKYFAVQSSDGLTRYSYEAERHWNLIEQRLASRRYILGDVYTIADMSLWGWARALPRVIGDDTWRKYPSTKRFVDEINARPAAQRAASLANRHDFKMELDESAISHMFRYRQQAARAEHAGSASEAGDAPHSQ